MIRGQTREIGRRVKRTKGRNWVDKITTGLNVDRLIICGINIKPRYIDYQEIFK